MRPPGASGQWARPQCGALPSAAYKSVSPSGCLAAPSNPSTHPSDSPPRQAGRQRRTHPRPFPPPQLGHSQGPRHSRLLAPRRRRELEEDRFRHGRQEGGAEAGPARQQGQAEGAQGGLHSPRYRLHLRGHEGLEADGGRAGGSRRRRGQAAQGRRRRHRLGRPGQGGEEGRRQERRRQEGWRQEGRRQEDAAAGHTVPAPPVVPVRRRAVPPPPVPAAVRRPQRRGGPQLLRHLLMMPLRLRRSRARRLRLLFVNLCVVGLPQARHHGPPLRR